MIPKTYVSGIYQIKCNITNKCYYGQTKGIINTRVKQHLNQLRKGSHPNIFLQRAFNKYKEENFSVSVIAHGIDLVDLDRLEIAIISLCKSTIDEYGYNLQSGGKAIQNPVKYVRDKISKSNTGKKMPQHVREAINKSHVGRKWEPDIIKKRADGVRNYYKSLDKHHLAKPLKDSNGKVWKSATEVGLFYKCDPTQVSRAVRRGWKFRGLYFEYLQKDIVDRLTTVENTVNMRNFR